MKAKIISKDNAGQHYQVQIPIKQSAGSVKRERPKEKLETGSIQISEEILAE